jgi:hypothetical protein
MESYLQMVSIPAITTIVYWVVALIRYTVNDNEKFKRFIPIVACLIGACSGAVAYYAMPSIIAAGNICCAVVIGGASGLSSIGAKQIISDFTKKNVEEETK